MPLESTQAALKLAAQECDHEADRQSLYASEAGTPCLRMIHGTAANTLMAVAQRIRALKPDEITETHSLRSSVTRSADTNQLAARYVWARGQLAKLGLAHEWQIDKAIDAAMAGKVIQEANLASTLTSDEEADMLKDHPTRRTP